MAERYEIGDGNSKSFKLLIETGTTKFSAQYWRSIDKGFIRFNSGKLLLKSQSKWGFLPDDFDAFLLSKDGTWGIRLNLIQGTWLLNDQGKGKLVQPWAVNTKPGTISWVKL